MILICIALAMQAAVAWVNAFGRDVRPVTSAPELLAPEGNPVPATPASVEAGRRLFRESCARCHGEGGRGDGPDAAQLSLRPADLYQHVPYHSDAQLFFFTSEGLFGTPMPSFKDKLSEEERWHIINYMRALTTPAER